MTRLVALLGSINTGGNRIKMADLRDALTNAGFANVATVTASGNVLFDGDPGQADTYRKQMAELLTNQFGIDTFAVIASREDLIATMDDSPFAATGADNFVHVHFLEHDPDSAAFDTLEADQAGRGPEKLARGQGVLHIDYVEGVGRSKLTGDFITRRLSCRGTARNIRSIRRIVEAMES
ncbi:MAG: DUF1697 domain-containing protein [Pseudomonadota bacterium]